MTENQRTWAFVCFKNDLGDFNMQPELRPTLVEG